MQPTLQVQMDTKRIDSYQIIEQRNYSQKN